MVMMKISILANRTMETGIIFENADPYKVNMWSKPVMPIKNRLMSGPVMY
jgi:hypothetical protein